MSEVATAHDPVCHMDILPATAAGISEHEGVTYYFCSGGCKKDFDADPAGVLAAEAAYDHSRPVDHMMMMDEAPKAAASAASGSKKPWWKFW